MRILLVVKHPIIRVGINSVLQDLDDRTSIYPVDKYDAGIEIATGLAIDVAVCFVETTEDARGVRGLAKSGVTCIALLTTYSEIVSNVINGGYVIPLYWQATTPDILRQTVLATEHEAILNTASVFRTVLERQAEAMSKAMGVYRLSPLHIDVLYLVAAGYKAKGICARLNRTGRVIYPVLSELRDYFGVDNDIALAIKAREMGLYHKE